MPENEDVRRLRIQQDQTHQQNVRRFNKLGERGRELLSRLLDVEAALKKLDNQVTKVTTQLQELDSSLAQVWTNLGDEGPPVRKNWGQAKKGRKGERK